MNKAWRRVAWFVVGAACTALFVAVLYALLSGARYSKDGASTADAIRQTQIDNHTLLDTITDCTQPTGRCFQRGQHQTAGAVASINRVVILAAACAVGRTGTVTQVQNAIQQCVISGLARQHAN